MHCDYTGWVVTQKSGTQKSRDKSRSAVNMVSQSDCVNSGAHNFRLDSSPTNKWKDAMSNRSFKESFTVAIDGQALIEAAKELYQNECSATTVVSGLRIFVTEEASTCSNPDDLHLTVEDGSPESSPVAIVHYRFDVNALPSFKNIKTCPSWAWSLSLSTGASGSGSDLNSIKTIRIRRAPQYDSRHGEAETRVQYLMYGQVNTENYCRPNQNLFYKQESKDSDKVCLAMLSHKMCGNRAPTNSFVKGTGKCFDIGALLEGLDARGIDPFSMARLYCLCGNDFNHSSEFATIDRMVSTYLQWHREVGNLSTLVSVQTLFYFCFLRAVRSDGMTPNELEGLVVMSPDWRKKARELIVCRTSARTTAHILPQDTDLELVLRRAVEFNSRLYWERMLEIDLTGITCDESVGYNPDGSMLLCSREELGKRGRILSQLNASCKCGKKAKGDSCCQTKRCPCRKSGKNCDERCGCPSNICSNSVVTRPIAKQAFLSSTDENDKSTGDEIERNGSMKRSRDAMDIENIIHNENEVENVHENDEVDEGWDDLTAGSRSSETSISQVELDSCDEAWKEIEELQKGILRKKKMV